MKLGFFCIKGLESFVDPIATHFIEKTDIDTEKHYIANFVDISEKINPCDVIWFEWANEVPLNLTMQLATTLASKKVIVRLHSYEALAQMHQQINWSVVDAVVFVSRHIQKYCHLEHDHQLVIPNGINLDDFEFVVEKTHGPKVGIIGYFSHKKGMMLLLHAFNSLPKNFELHVAGEWQDERERVYFSHMLTQMDLKDRVTYYGRIAHEEVPGWMADKNYIICSSPWEGHPVSICEAMATGTKPLIHNFWGSHTVFPDNLIWTTLNDLNQMVSPESPYNPHSYRQYVASNYDQKNILKKITNLIQYVKA